MPTIYPDSNRLSHDCGSLVCCDGKPASTDFLSATKARWTHLLFSSSHASTLFWGAALHAYSPCTLVKAGFRGSDIEIDVEYLGEASHPQHLRQLLAYAAKNHLSIARSGPAGDDLQGNQPTTYAAAGWISMLREPPISFSCCRTRWLALASFLRSSKQPSSR